MKTRSWFLAGEDWWSVYLGLFLVLIGVVFLVAGAPLDLIKSAVPASWPQNPLLAGIASNWLSYVCLFGVLIVLLGIAVGVMAGRVWHFVASFAILVVASLVVLVIGSQQTLKAYGLEYPFWALIVGLLVGNFVHLPEWFRAASQRTELYIKVGIVLLGASLPFTIIVQGGLWGFLEALVIVAVGFSVAFLMARALGFDNRFAAVLGAGSSVCGISAAIAVGSSVKAEEKDVGYVVSLVMLYALVLIFVLPILGRALKLAEVVIGAWIGGSELADAAGLAAAALVGNKAVSAFSLVKLNRDVMIGFLAFIFAAVSVARWERAASFSGREGSVAGGLAAEGESLHTSPSARIIWERFPKFVLAFLAASIIVTLLVTRLGKPAIDSHLIAVLNTFRTWLFTLAFLCIGLNTSIRDIRRLGPKPILAFTVVVVVNLVLGFLLANLFFGGILAKPLG